MPKHKRSKPSAIVALKRNGALADAWSPVHFVTGILLGWLMNPLLAFGLMIVWEPLEIFVLSPLLGRKGVIFGYESLHNSLSDMVFGTAGILVGCTWLALLIQPPFILFA